MTDCDWHAERQTVGRDIEVTPKMEAAGASVLCGFETDTADEGYWAVLTYRAMEQARRASMAQPERDSIVLSPSRLDELTDEQFSAVIASARRRYPDREVLAWGLPGREQPKRYPPLIMEHDCIDNAAGDVHPHGHEVTNAPLGQDAITLREFE